MVPKVLQKRQVGFLEPPWAQQGVPGGPRQALGGAWRASRAPPRPFLVLKSTVFGHLHDVVAKMLMACAPHQISEKIVHTSGLFRGRCGSYGRGPRDGFGLYSHSGRAAGDSGGVRPQRKFRVVYSKVVVCSDAARLFIRRQFCAVTLMFRPVANGLSGD